MLNLQPYSLETNCQLSSLCSLHQTLSISEFCHLQDWHLVWDDESFHH